MGAPEVGYGVLQNPPSPYANKTSPTAPAAPSTKSSLPSYGSDDALFGFSLEEQLEFFKRMARFSALSDPGSLAAILLAHWTVGRGVLKVIPNNRIKDHSNVKEQLVDYRKVYLSEKKTNWASGNIIAGVVPRLKKGTWDGVSSLSMNYESKSFDIVSVTRYGTLQTKQFIGRKLSAQDEIDLDLFASLHTTSLASEVTVDGTRAGADVTVHFKKFECRIKDNYNWDPGEHLTVPNPDYKNFYAVAKPVRPDQNSVRIYHNHQIELEKNGMAHSFDFESDPWLVSDPDIVSDGKVTA